MVLYEASPSGAQQLPKYQVLMELGSGGMGQVHLAMSRGPRGFVKLVVLKSLKAELLGNNSTTRMFHEEARISARLAHPNLVQTYEVIEQDGVPTMVLEYVEGQSLESILEQSDRQLDRDIHLTILTKVLAGLHAAHELRDFDGASLHLIHRDVSPQNVMLQFDGQVKVLDFGIAKTEHSRVATDTGILKGKIRYMAPEQLAGDAMDRRVDVFSVGIMLWEALAQARFWGDLEDGDVMRGLLNGDVPRLPQSSDIPPELSRICHRAIAIQPASRYASAGDFLHDLEAYLTRAGWLCTAERLGSYLIEHFDAKRQHAQRIINAHILALEESQRPPAPPVGEVTVLEASAGTARNERSISRVILARVGVTRMILLVVASVAVIAVALFAWSRSSAKPTGVDPNGAMDERARAAPIDGPICPENTKACDGACVTLDRPEYGCGSSSCLPCVVTNATPRCNRNNACDIAVCYQAFDNCDGDATNGCEVKVRIDPDHCGSCGARCPELPNAKRGCGDICTIWRCEAGYSDCNKIVADGCETAVMTDRHNCGRCGAACPANGTCREGKCRP